MNDTQKKFFFRVAADAPRKASRQEVDLSKFSNPDLVALIRLLDAQESPFLDEALGEAQRRYTKGIMVMSDVDETPPPPRESLPHWLKIWPFCLLWSQRPR
jgi:hypothetical protein